MRIALSFVFILFLFSCNTGDNRNSNNQDSNPGAGNQNTPTYEEKRQSLADTERDNPLDFVKVRGTYRQNLINQWVLEGTISNTATTARYKDVVVKVTYYSRTDTELGSEDKVFYEFFGPNSTRDFKLKVDGYGGTAKIGYEISSAVAVY